MRFLRLDFGDDLHSLDLHPLVSVVAGLSVGQQRQLFGAVRSLARGSSVGVRGLAEHGASLTELDGQANNLLSTLSTEADVVVYVDGAARSSQLVGLQAEMDRWARQAAIDAVAVEEIRADLKPSLRAEVADLRRTLEPTALNGSEITSWSVQRMRYLAVRKAFDAVQSHDPHIDSCDPEVAELIGRWEDFQSAHAQHKGHLTQLQAELEAAEDEVDGAKVALEQAELEAKPALLTPAEEARLEELSDLNSRSRKQGWLRPGPNPDEQAELRQLLAKVGVTSWTEYSMFRLSPSVAPEKEAAVEAARAELNQAIEQLEQIRYRVAGDEISMRLETMLGRIRSDARAHLGALVPTDFGTALRGLITRTENPQRAAALNDLRDVLASNDLRPPYGYDPEEILGWTASWLEAEGRLHDVGEAEAGAGQPGPEAIERLEGELDRAETRLRRHRRAMARIDRAERQAAASARRLSHLRHQWAELANRAEPRTAQDVLCLVRPVVKEVMAECGASVPVVVTGSMEGMDRQEIENLMSELETMAADVQMIVVTTRPEAGEWATEVGPKRALLAGEARSLI